MSLKYSSASALPSTTYSAKVKYSACRAGAWRITRRPDLSCADRRGRGESAAHSGTRQREHTVRASEHPARHTHVVAPAVAVVVLHRVQPLCDARDGALVPRALERPPDVQPHAHGQHVHRAVLAIEHAAVIERLERRRRPRDVTGGGATVGAGAVVWAVVGGAGPLATRGWGEWGGARWAGVSVGRNRSRQHEALGRGALAKRRGVGLEAGRWLGGMGYGWGRGACVAPSRRDVPAWRWRQCSRPSTPAPPPPPPPRASRPCRWQQLAASPPHAGRRRSPTAAACAEARWVELGQAASSAGRSGEGAIHRPQAAGGDQSCRGGLSLLRAVGGEGRAGQETTTRCKRRGGDGAGSDPAPRVSSRSEAPVAAATAESWLAAARRRGRASRSCAVACTP
eukprot:scaffold25920_cov64-Phaeocystis_antarctica.AAC.6